MDQAPNGCVRDVWDVRVVRVLTIRRARTNRTVRTTRTIRTMIWPGHVFNRHLNAQPQLLAVRRVDDRDRPIGRALVLSGEFLVKLAFNLFDGLNVPLA